MKHNDQPDGSKPISPSLGNGEKDASVVGDHEIARPPGKRRFVVLVVVLLFLAAGGVIYWRHAEQFATTDDAEIGGPIYQIAPRIAGSVLAVEVRCYQHVSKGETLVRLDPAPEDVAFAHAKAEAAHAKAQVDLRTAGLAEAKANVAEKKAKLFKAQHNDARYERVNPQAITKTTLDNATAALRVAAARTKAAVEQVVAARAALAAAKASARAANVTVKNAELQLSYTEIRAPTSGSIAKKAVRTGDIVSSGTPLMAVVGGRIWVTADYRETQLSGIRIGQKARIFIDAVPGVAFRAKVVAIQRGTGSVFSLLPAENATGNYVKVVQRVPVRLVFDDSRIKDYVIVPGMSVEPYIRLDGK